MIKLIVFIYSLITAQNIYNGQITFNYNGTVDGSFDSIIEDSTKSSVLLNQENLDDSFIIIGSITEQEQNTYDIFLSILQDTTFPVQERTWEIPGEGDEEEPLSLETLTLFIPGIDSSFAIDFFNLLNDSTNLNDSTELTEYLESILLEFSDYLYIGISGELNFYSINDSSILGEFNSVMLKPEFYFPPHMITINNGSMIFNKITTPELTIINDNDIIPKTLKITNCYPNPFNSEINIKFFSNHENTFLSIYNINGKLIKTYPLVSLKKEKHLFKWNANKYPSGIYIIKLNSKEFIQTRKIMYLK
mgnify:CR=1 FL=1